MSIFSFPVSFIVSSDRFYGSRLPHVSIHTFLRSLVNAGHGFSSLNVSADTKRVFYIVPLQMPFGLRTYSHG